jgi:hypothetical protein
MSVSVYNIYFTNLFYLCRTRLTPEINNQSKSIFTQPSLQFPSKFVFECANNVSTLRVVTYMDADTRLIRELIFTSD